jgi:hypothetical protein
MNIALQALGSFYLAGSDTQNVSSQILMCVLVVVWRFRLIVI